MTPREESVVVCAKHRGHTLWYRSHPEYWILDRERWDKAFRRHGFPVDPGDHASRFGLPVVDETTVATFLRSMEPFRVDRETLARELVEVLPAVETWFDLVEFLPVVYVDVDSRILYSTELESWGFQNYVPDGWEGRLESFLDHIDEAERYWVVGGRSCIAKFLDGAES